MNKFFLIIALVSFSGYSQTLVKADKQDKFDLNNQEKIFSSNAGYCKIYKVEPDIFILWNGYSEIDRITVANRDNLDELVRASKMILNADYNDEVYLETIPVYIKKEKIIGTTYSFYLTKQNTDVDMSDLTYSEINELAKTSDVNSVQSDGEKVIDKVKRITSEVTEGWMSLTKKQLEKLIGMNY
ncbi:hypothetical protein C7S20_19250 [Christiangramia fulva]|uniref:Uncharacterized protein n=1 Tax=Christiangramia fulva TaxID=2126553 RepID=A0A2R3ZAA8_9FLAO|nr:hypothetical protein [Christiangramia fulva]AVR47215.1 hypothetical protein C7S20_19250 [Christiangramia fulva]